MFHHFLVRWDDCWYAFILEGERNSCTLALEAHFGEVRYNKSEKELNDNWHGNRSICGNGGSGIIRACYFVKLYGSAAPVKLEADRRHRTA